MSIASKIKQLGARQEVPEFSARLKSVEFLERGALKISVAHKAKLPRDTGFELVIVQRDNEAEVKVYAASEFDEQQAVFTIDVAGVKEARTQEKPTDVFLRMRVGSSMLMKRLGVENSRVLPYFTSHNNLSFKPEK